MFRHVGLSSSFGWASDHGEPRSAWWSAGILRFFVSVCLAGVMVSVCCWLALVCPSRQHYGTYFLLRTRATWLLPGGPCLKVWRFPLWVGPVCFLFTHLCLGFSPLSGVTSLTVLALHVLFLFFCVCCSHLISFSPVFLLNLF